jgi:hypothetical protein
MAKNKSGDGAADVTYRAKSLGMNNQKPTVDGEYMDLDQCMMNDGMSAQALAKKLGASLDSDFPVK